MVRSPLCSTSGIAGNITLIDDGWPLLTFNSLELPWLNNASNASAIPAGAYDAFIRNSPSNGTVVELKNVPDCTNIQIHKGNFISDTVGCVLIGMGKGTSTANPTLTESKAGVDAFMRTVSSMASLDSGRGAPTNLSVRISGCAG